MGEALALLGVDEQRARRLGIDIYKVGMVWPLETEGARAFLRGKEEASWLRQISFVEKEKRRRPEPLDYECTRRATRGPTCAVAYISGSAMGTQPLAGVSSKAWMSDLRQVAWAAGPIRADCFGRKKRC